MNGDEPRPGFNRQEALEFVEHQLRIDLATFEVNTRRMSEETKAGNAAGTEAIKACTLINGGAAVAILALVGHLASIHATPMTIMNFVRPLGSFVLGVFVGVIASGVVYLTHLCYFTSLECEFDAIRARQEGNEGLATTKDQGLDWWKKLGRRVVNPLAVLAAAASLALFVVGCCCAYHAFKSGIVINSSEDQSMFRGFF